MRLEDTIDLPPASIDMVFAATMLHLTDVDKALEAVAHQLKPGGTFAAPMLGIIRFSDTTVHEKYVALLRAGVDQVGRKYGKEFMAKDAVNASGYDSIALPPSLFAPGSQRVRLNEISKFTPGGGTIYESMIGPQLRAEWPLTSRIAGTEEVISEPDDTWMVREDVHFVKHLVDTFPFDLEAEGMKRCWTELADEIGDKTIEARWVVYLVLATRK